MAGSETAVKRQNIAGAARMEAPSLLQRVDVHSAEKGSKDSVSLVNGTVRLLYWESILADTVSASIIFTDSGNTMTRTKKGQGAGKRKKKVSAVEGLPITGGETVELKFTDNSENTISFNKDGNNLFINSIAPIPTDSQTTSKSYELILTSKAVSYTHLTLPTSDLV